MVDPQQFPSFSLEGRTALVTGATRASAATPRSLSPTPARTSS